MSHPVNVDSLSQSLFWFECTKVIAYTKYLHENPVDRNRPTWWRLVFFTKSGYYVTFDMVIPNPQAPTGLLQLRASNEDLGLAVTRAQWVELAARGCTVAEVLQAIQKSGYDRYRFTAGGRGNRHWVRMAVNMLEKTGLLANGSSYALEREIKYLYPPSPGSDRIFSEPVAGIFSGGP